MTTASLQSGAVEVSALVFELASSSLRAGWVGDDQPKVIIPSTVVLDRAKGQYRVGQTALWALGSNNPNFSPVQIIKGNQVNDWNALKAIWAEALKNLGAFPNEHPIILVCHGKFAESEALCQTAFDMGHPAVFLAKAPVMAAFAAGRPASAIVVDLGLEACRVSAVHEGYLMLAGWTEEKALGGQSLSAQALHMLREKIDLPPMSPFKTESLASDFKEHVMAVLRSEAFSPEKATVGSSLQYEFNSNDNSTILTVGAERFRLGECLFDPINTQFATEKGTNTPRGLMQLIEDVTSALDTEQRAALNPLHVVLTGSGSLVPGLSERLAMLLASASYASRYKLHTGSAGGVGLAGSLERKFGAWLGGSILGSIAAFQAMWCTAQEWREQGPTACISKSFPA